MSDPIARAIRDALAVLGQRLEPVEPYAVEEPKKSWPVRETSTI